MKRKVRLFITLISPLLASSSPVTANSEEGAKIVRIGTSLLTFGGIVGLYAYKKWGPFKPKDPVPLKKDIILPEEEKEKNK